MIDPLNFATILSMALATYFTRIGGYLLLRDRVVGERTRLILESAPGCVLITIIAPQFVSGRPADLMALAVTILAATRLSLLPTVLIAMASAAMFRSLIHV